MFEDFAEAIIVQHMPGERAVRRSARCAVLLVLLFPLFLGGRLPGARDWVKLIFYAFLALLFCIRLSEARFAPTLQLTKLSARLLICAGLFFLIVWLQVLPLPLVIVRLLSPEAHQLYAYSGATFASLSLDSSLTLSDLYWWLLLVILFFWFVTRQHVEGGGWRILGEYREGDDYLVRTFQDALIVAGTLCALIGLVHRLFGISALFGIVELQRDEQRLHYPFSNPNHMASFMEMTIAIGLGRLLALRYSVKTARVSSRNVEAQQRRIRERRVQLRLALCLAPMLGALVLTISKAGIILTGFSCACLLVYFFRSLPKVSPAQHERKKRADRARLLSESIATWMTRVLITLTVVLFFAFVLGRMGRELLQERAGEGLEQGIDEVRRAFFWASLKLTRFSPLFGVGLGCWHLAAAGVMPRELGQYRLDFAHNEYLQLLVETGVLGALPSVAALLLLLEAGRRLFFVSVSQRVERLGTLFAVLLPLLHALVDFHFHVPAFSFAYILTLVIYLRQLEQPARLEPERTVPGTRADH